MFSFGQLFGMIASALATQAAKYVAKQIGHPDSSESKAWVQVGSLALEVGAAALAAKPDHPDLRAGAAAVLDAIAQSGVNAITPTNPAPAPAPVPVVPAAPAAPAPAPSPPNVLVGDELPPVMEPLSIEPPLGTAPPVISSVPTGAI